MKRISLLLIVLLSVSAFAQKSKRAKTVPSASSAAATPQDATKYLLAVFASGNAAKGGFLGLKGSKRRTDPNGTDIYNITGMRPFGAADHYLMFSAGSTPTFVAEFNGLDCDHVIAAITDGLPKAAPAGEYGFKLVTKGVAEGSKQYALTKRGKSFAIFAHDLAKGSGMFVMAAGS